MKALLAVTKRLLASNKISFILTAVVVLCATSSGDVILSNGNYTWLLAVLTPFFFVFYDFTKLMHLGGQQKGLLLRLPDQLWISGILYFPGEHGYTSSHRPCIPREDRDQSDGCMPVDRKRHVRCRTAANVLFAACHDFSSCAAVHAGPLVWLAD